MSQKEKGVTVVVDLVVEVVEEEEAEEVLMIEAQEEEIVGRLHGVVDQVALEVPEVPEVPQIGTQTHAETEACMAMMKAEVETGTEVVEVADVTAMVLVVLVVGEMEAEMEAGMREEHMGRHETGKGIAGHLKNSRNQSQVLMANKDPG